MILLLSTAFAYNFIDECNGEPTRWSPAESDWALTVPAGSTAYSLLTNAEVIAANEAGWVVWADTVSCCSGWEASYIGTTTTPFDTNDDENVVAFEETTWDEAAFGSQNLTIAITVPSYFTSSCLIDNADQIYNGVGFDFSVVANPNSFQTDLQSIMAHENGHWLGLDHTPIGGGTMFASYSGGTGSRTLHVDDEAGVCDSHPGQCGPQEVCDNNVDDDGDGDVDCADIGCATFPGCVCPVTGEVGCDASVTSTNAGGGNTVDSYSCGVTATGPEVVYTFTPNEDGEVIVQLTGLTADVDLVVSTENGGSCEVDNCQSSANGQTGDEYLAFNGFGGVTYAVVVDGYEGAVGDFTLSTQCPASQGGGECLSVLPPLECNTAIEGSNFGFANDVQGWNCVDWETTGPEAVYSFTAPADGNVIVTLEGLTADLDLFVTDRVDGGCSEDGCIAFSGASNEDSESLSFEASAGTTYMVVADGFTGATSNFTINTNCEVSTAPTPTGPPGVGEDCEGCQSGSAPSFLWALPFVLLARRRNA